MPNTLPLRPQEASDAPIDPIRTAVRFPLELPVVLHTSLGALKAVTVDISSTGVLLFLSQSLPIESALQWVMYLPASVLGTPADVAIECSGRVIWSCAFGSGHHIGAVIDEYILRDEVP